MTGRVGLISGFATAQINNSGTWSTTGLNGLATLGLGGAGTGNASINNDGTIDALGVTTFGFASINGSNTVNNNAGATFNATGLTTFGMASTDNNRVNNAGTFNSTGTTTFLMASPGDNNVANNSGVYNVVGNLLFLGGPGAQFNNTGLIDMRNGQVSDYTYVSGGFNASGGSTLGVNAQLGGPGSIADRLGMRGNVTGTTAISVKDVGGVASYNPFGIAVVGIGGSGSSRNFVLSADSSYYRPIAGGVLSKGLFNYYLTDNLVATGCSSSLLVGSPSDCVVLASAPNGVAHQLPAATTAAQEIWYNTNLLWEDRQSEIRGLVFGAPIAARPLVTKGPAPVVQKFSTFGVWAKGIGSWTNRNNYWNDGQRFGFDVGYQQNTFGFVAGGDMAVRGLLNANDTLIFGPLGGYTESNVNFRDQGTNFKYSGGTVGGTASYLINGFFADALIKADILNLTMNLPTLANSGFSNGSTLSTTWGFIGNTGYHWNVGMFFAEPILTIAYANTQINSLNMPALLTRVNFNNGESVRGAAGGRLGASLDNLWSGKRVDLTFTGRAWDEWGAGANTATLDNPGVPVLVTDRFTRVYGEIKGGADLIALGGGLGAFVNGGVKWNNQLTTTFVKGGVGYTW
jgi:outer membrane autotransporter protein